MAGQPLITDPQSLWADSQAVRLPMFHWNPSGFSYQPVSELKLGQGYWMLCLSSPGETLSIPLQLSDTYTVQLKAGWNLVGGVSTSIDFFEPQDDPDQSVVAGSLYEWHARGYAYRPARQIEPGKGYWLLALQECQLTLDSSFNTLAAPQQVPRPKLLIPLRFISAGSSRQLEIGLDDTASHSFDDMDQPMPPATPLGQQLDVYLTGQDYRLRREIKSVSAETVSWQIRISSPQPVQLSADSQQIPKDQELVVIDGQVETMLTAGVEMKLDGGERELTVSLRPLPTVTQLLPNYPNPFNPETWIPYQLHQQSEVRLGIYSSNGTLVREIDLGLKAAGNYQSREEAGYWDSRNQNGEQVSSGVYFYQIQAEGYRQMRKMLILK